MCVQVSAFATALANHRRSNRPFIATSASLDFVPQLNGIVKN